ncbi:hypothetical protein JP75_20605 [Devosia riboflavina]|uniref:Uncharacterized protein n=1 Tax=Devosia riboflavina TaxID=46914 RepID=A0A087LXX6_9HYPH|nr:hypothetical protein [Devosia riboflavina]KFL29479.1 hypothetical protein JP75_20605 [Devosia riboflavina]
MSKTEYSQKTNLKDVEPGSDADETPVPEVGQTPPDPNNVSKDSAAAMPQGRKPGPKDSPVQVRDAGANAQAETPRKWDDVDEAVDESFPASDASAKY